MGIEEGGTSWNKDNIKYLENYNRFFQSNFKKPYCVPNNFATESSANDDKKSLYIKLTKVIEHYYNSTTFLLNLSPLGFNSKDRGINDRYINFFPIHSRAEFLNYEKPYYNMRIDVLKTLFKNNFNKITIFYFVLVKVIGRNILEL